VSGPLDGVRVVDFSQVIAGPYGSAVLADHGASVVKIEPLQGEMWRSGGMGGGFLSLNRGKRSLPLQLQSGEGREVFYQLIRNSDVLVENFRPGVMERLKLEYATLSAINPRLLHVSVTAFGASGPYAHRPGFDPLLQALAGTERAQGGRDNPPVFLRIAITDYVTALLQAATITLALFNRERTGRGEHLNLSLLRSGIFINADAFTRYEGRPERPLPDKGQHGLGPLDRMYQGSDGEWLFLLAPDDASWQKLRSVATLSNVAEDARNDPDALAATLEAVFKSRPASESLAELAASGVPCAPVVVGYDRLFWEDVQPMVNGYVVRGEHPERGHLEMDGNFIHFSASSPRHDMPMAPQLGQHTREILRELGYNDKAIDRFKATGVTI
jgi:formyl-CoA transferase/CoA:oxalate CoA-transferase